MKNKHIDSCLMIFKTHESLKYSKYIHDFIVYDKISIAGVEVVSSILKSEKSDTFELKGD